MWIRSQDKEELVKCNSVYYTEEFCLNEGNYLVGLCDGLIRSIGQYSTKEKALKVLDTIAKQMEFCIETRTRTIPYAKGLDWDEPERIAAVVFQIPQDNEVMV